MTASFTESVVQQTALAWLESAGWRVLHGAEAALSGSKAKLFLGRLV